MLVLLIQYHSLSPLSHWKITLADILIYEWLRAIVNYPLKTTTVPSMVTKTNSGKKKQNGEVRHHLYHHNSSARNVMKDCSLHLLCGLCSKF